MIRGCWAVAVAVGLTGGALFASPAGAAPSQTSATSTAWAGYVDAGETFTSVSASWVQPAQRCNPKHTQGETRVAQFVVGLDGWSDVQHTEEAGTRAICSSGSAVYATWYEMYPSGGGNYGGEISAGDQITASVSYNGTDFVLSVTDAQNSAASFSETEPCPSNGGPCDRASAQVVASREFAAGSTGSFSDLAHFERWQPRDITVSDGPTTGGITSFDSDQVTMVDTKGDTMAEPTPLGSVGGFGVRWVKAF
jgi:hypothetical protein